MSDICIYYFAYLYSVNLSVCLFFHLFYCLSMICLSVVLLNVYLFFVDCPIQSFVYDCLCLCLCRNLFKNSVCLLICLLIRLSLYFTVYQSICLSVDLIWWSYSIVKKPQCMGVLFFHIEHHNGVWYIPHSIVVFYMEKHNALWFYHTPLWFFELSNVFWIKWYNLIYHSAECLCIYNITQ